MTQNGAVREAVNRWRRALMMPTPLIRADRARPIDRVIDYFGGAGRSAASVAPVRPRSVPWREAQPVMAVRG